MKRAVTFVLSLSLFAIAGCGGTAYYTLSSHTVSVAPDQEQDVVWLEDSNGNVYRCTQASCSPPSGLR